jgi:hypothetical protein
MFEVDSLPGVAALDNLGIAESGDGISDVMQEAKWESDYLAKLQDADGGFYFLTYPRNREYESNVTPEDGDPQVVWPKTTSVTAAAIAALAQCASSPLFKQTYPAAAALYLQKAKLGWSFLTNAIAKHGEATFIRRSPPMATTLPTTTKWLGPHAKSFSPPEMPTPISCCSPGSILPIRNLALGLVAHVRILRQLHPQLRLRGSEWARRLCQPIERNLSGRLHQ